MQHRRLQRVLPGYFFITALAIVFFHLFSEAHWVDVLGNVVAIVLPIGGASLLAALYLAVTGHALVRHKRLGYWLAFGFLVYQLATVFIVLLATVLIYEEIDEYVTVDDVIRYSILGVVLVAVLVILVRCRKSYTAPLAERSFRRALLTAVAGIALTILAAFGTAFVLNGTEHRQLTFGTLLRQLTLPKDNLFPEVQVVLAAGAVITLIAASIALLWSRATTRFIDLDQELELRQLMLNQADQEADSLAYFATRRDKGLVFSNDAKAAIAYRNVMDSSIASGDPIGPKDHWDSAIKNFLTMATNEGLAPAAAGVSEAGARAYARAGLKVRALGDESVVYTERFDLDDPKLVDVRAAHQRLSKEGYTARIRRHKDLSEAEMQRLIDFADRWRQNGDDRGFSMALGRLGDPLDGQCVFVEALDAEGETRGLLSFVPWGTSGLSLDVMRRDLEEAGNGVTEFMVASLMLAGREIGVQRVSLNFAFLRETIAAGEDVGATLMQRLAFSAISVASKKFQIEQLYRSNVKYDPQWLTRYICWRNTSDFAAIALAYGLAEGQVSIPLLKDGARPQPAYHPNHPQIVDFLEHARPALPQPKRPQQVQQKMSRRASMLQQGTDPYPTDFHRDHRLSELADLPEGTAVRTAGRVIGRSDHGGVQFYRLRDWDTTYQVLIERDAAGAATLAQLKHDIALGDHIGVSGVLGSSRNGTPSIIASDIRVTSKSLRPIPRQALADEEVKVRQRYLDLITSSDARHTVRARSAVIQSIRSTLLGEDFLEVETPLLQTIHGGANARPFRTHINAYNMDLYLRIAPELYLKRLMVGGVDRVFEIGRNFRNEGADATHNPEFTMLEAYQAYGDYTTMRELTQRIIVNAALAANGHTIVRGKGHDGKEHEVDLAKPWRVLTVHEGISEAVGQAITPDTPMEHLRALAEQHGIDAPEDMSRGALIIELHEELSEQFAIAPTFYTDFPTDVSPLTRQHRVDERVAEKWDLICFGAEVATAYSELIDPVVQRERLVSQSLLAAGGDPEAMEVDEDFLTALEYAMPPSGGMGMGVDRLVMMLTQKNIRETIAFPLVKPNA